MSQKVQRSEFKPFDVSINNNQVRELFEQHLGLNLKLYVDGKLKAGTRYALITKWVGKTWERVKEKKILLNIYFKNAAYLTIWTVARMPLSTSKVIICPCPKRSSK